MTTPLTVVAVLAAAFCGYIIGRCRPWATCASCWFLGHRSLPKTTGRTPHPDLLMRPLFEMAHEWECRRCGKDTSEQMGSWVVAANPSDAEERRHPRPDSPAHDP